MRSRRSLPAGKVLVLTRCLLEIAEPLAEFLGPPSVGPGWCSTGDERQEAKESSISSSREDCPPFFVLSLKAGGCPGEPDGGRARDPLLAG